MAILRLITPAPEPPLAALLRSRHRVDWCVGPDCPPGIDGADLVLLDIRLADAEHDPSAELRSSGQPFVAIVPPRDRDAMRRAIQLGALRCLPQPYDDAIVLGIVDISLAICRRLVISEALGILVGRYRLTRQQAAERLAEASMTRREPKIAIARRIIADSDWQNSLISRPDRRRRRT